MEIVSKGGKGKGGSGYVAEEGKFIDRKFDYVGGGEERASANSAEEHVVPQLGTSLSYLLAWNSFPQLLR